VVIAQLFDALKVINLVSDGKETLAPGDMALLADTYRTFLTDILGLLPEEGSHADDSLVNDLMGAILTFRKEARERKDFAASDRIRDELEKIRIRIKDTKDGAVWEKF
jgi:cysteinyl-tRNA synthetase